VSARKYAVDDEGGAHAMKSEHPNYVLALHTRTRLLGTLNLAVALGGRSTGWGKGGRPRRTFVGRHRSSLDGNAPYHRAVELLLIPHGMKGKRTVLRVPLGSGIAPLRRLPGVANRLLTGVGR
jgi:hypothetical protein